MSCGCKKPINTCYKPPVKKCECKTWEFGIWNCRTVYQDSDSVQNFVKYNSAVYAYINECEPSSCVNPEDDTENGTKKGEYWLQVVKDGDTPIFRINSATGYLQISWNGGDNWANVVDENGNPISVIGSKGDTGIGIDTVVQTVTSHLSGGRNTITVTLTDGTSTNFFVQNGIQSSDCIPLEGVTASATAAYQSGILQPQVAVIPGYNKNTGIISFAFDFKFPQSGTTSGYISIVPESMTVNASETTAIFDYVTSNMNDSSIVVTYTADVTSGGISNIAINTNTKTVTVTLNANTSTTHTAYNLIHLSGTDINGDTKTAQGVLNQSVDTASKYMRFLVDNSSTVTGIIYNYKGRKNYTTVKVSSNLNWKLNNN